MAGKLRTPVFSENFIRNLDAIQSFLKPQGGRAFDDLLDRLVDEIVPMLRRYPQPGRLFLSHPIHSREGQLLLRKLKAKMKKGDDLREFVSEESLILYLLRGTRIIFLSIKHHRQLSFDLRRFWS
ncbi:MAG: type II toxin-antitoxin system RelE/ParE family toxin [Nitrospirae bacterium]|nr:type II toxin-antitoxin system RelE/ParE family toxin [Candidatus Manganitrophaceae bacterium]